MANSLYPTFKEELLSKQHNLSTDTIRATLIDSGAYVYSPGHSSFATDVPVGAQTALSLPLASKTIALGVFDSADFVWSAVAGPQSEAIILWNQQPSAPVNQPLIAFYDTGMTGMPVTPNGGDINVTVNASGWFAL